MCKCPLIYFTEIICSTANIFLYRSHYLHSNKLGLRAKYHFREIIDRMAPPPPRGQRKHISVAPRMLSNRSFSQVRCDCVRDLPVCTGHPASGSLITKAVSVRALFLLHLKVI